ncbi:hypothetical protein L7F22_051029 [Adiantum nelumboides]|nr:hypothetical protein [Adiantum nelumboides]
MLLRKDLQRSIVGDIDILMVQEHKIAQPFGNLMRARFQTFWEPACGQHSRSCGVCIFVGPRLLSSIRHHGTLVVGGALYVAIDIDGFELFLLQAWYDVKIISKVYKHPLYTCGCRFRVQFYSDWSENPELRSTRALLEGATVEVSISEIAIMQVALDSPLDVLLEMSLTLGADAIKRQWSRDSYTLNLTCSSQQSLYSTSAEDAGKKSAASGRHIHMTDFTEKIHTDLSLKNTNGQNILQKNSSDHLKDAIRVHDLNDERITVNGATLVDLTSSEDLSVHGNTDLIQELRSPSQLIFETGKNRTRIDLPCKAKITNTGVYAERGRGKKRARHMIINSEPSFHSSDECSYKLSGSGSDSDSEESLSCEHTTHQEEETTDSQSRSTPIFYGNVDETQAIVESFELSDRKQGEDEERSTSTKTFYGNTTENSGQSCSTAIFHGSCANEAGKSLVDEDSLKFMTAAKSVVEGQDECFPTKISCTEYDNAEVDSISTSCQKKKSSECFCNAVQISSDHSQSVCKACIYLQGDDSIVMTTPAISQGERLKKGQVVVSNSNDYKNVPDTQEYCSESESVQQYKILKRGEKNNVDSKNMCKLVPLDTKKRKHCARGVSHSLHNIRKNLQGTNDACSESESMQEPKELKKRKKVEVEHKGKCKLKPPPTNKERKRGVSRTQDRGRFSKPQEWKRNFNDLFDAILRSDRELTHVKMAEPSEEIQKPKVSWDPIIFCESMHVSNNDLMEDEPLKGLWRDMELAVEEMRGVAALAEQNFQPPQDKGLACEHDLVLNEQEGYVCSLCGVLVTSIENILPRVLQEEADQRSRDNQTQAIKMAVPTACNNSTEIQNKPTGPFETDMGSVWMLVKDLRPLLQKNQVDGFNFLWNNIGALSSQTDTKGGGCIVAHAPGTGKSLLIISFLKSFLHLHAWCRPLIVAPKNMLLSWKKEFEKWKAGIKVYVLQASPPLTYLNNISEWQKNKKSVLIINYQLFSQLVDEGRMCRAREIQQIGSLLLHIPDILVLDEGHVARNFSKLRESLMQSRTKFKILVSGTLFQNNMQELFNLLYLVRPNFLGYLPACQSKNRFEGLDLDNESSKKQWQTFEEFDKGRRVHTRNEQAELRLRKIFMEEIGTKLEGKVQEAGGDDNFRNAIEQLRATMAPFVHFYAGDILKSLPGIKEFIVVLQATSLQMSLSTQIKQQTFLETALSIHPSLLLNWKGKISSFLELDELHEIRGDASQGPKVKFILDLAECCHLLNEKLLIFSQFVKTMELVAEFLPKKFKVAMIKGKDRLEERQRTIEEFNESGGTSILLASLTACGEGINLTGASRVVFLDMHWNPARMKQAVARAFRIGQTRVVYTYWLIASVEKEAEKFTRIQRKDWLSRSIFSLGVEIPGCHFKESHPNVEVQDYVLAQLLRNDISKSILRVLNYSASDREKLSAFLGHWNFPET